MSRPIQPVILSGGAGERLWPLSRTGFPKQFLKLTSHNTLLQNTAIRARDLGQAASPFIICNDSHRFLVAEQFRSIGWEPGEIILEPVARNTAPAIVAAALIARTSQPETIILVLPSDHVIDDNSAFQEALTQAIAAANEGLLVAFGIKPTNPDTGLGYIRRGDKLTQGSRCFKVETFVEKPDFNTTSKFMLDDKYYWNSGIYLFRVDNFLAEIAAYKPDVLNATKLAVENARRDLDFIRLEKTNFSNNPSISIDYALMEQTKKAAVVTCELGWSDVGTWNALWKTGEQDNHGNVTIGDVFLEDTQNSLVYSNDRLVVALGVQESLIVETSDAVLIANREQSQNVRAIVKNLRKMGRSEVDLTQRTYRPWGYYESIDSGTQYQVKRICVMPGGQLSLQMHRHRAEHWIVVEGLAKVTCGTETLLLGENESTYIPTGVKHRLENPADKDLKLIEVQTGTYLGEDDIIRFEDIYGRNDGDNMSNT